MPLIYDRSIEYRLVSYKENWSFTPIWKNGTMSIFETFSQNFPNIERAETNHQMHSFIYHPPESDDLKMLHRDSEEYLEFVDQSFNFLCLRNPYRRFISNFYHKIILNPTGKEAVDFLSKYNVANQTDVKKLKLFVEYISSEENIDPHFWTQSHLADCNTIKYSYVVNMETMEKDWKQLSDRFSNVPNLHKEKLHESGSDIIANIVAKEKEFKKIYNKIQMLYLDDYKLLESFR